MLRKIKQIFSAFLIASTTLSLNNFVFAEEINETPVNIQINGTFENKFDYQPIMRDNVVYISSYDANKIFGIENSDNEEIAIRKVAEEKGYLIGWDSDDNSVVLIDKDKLLQDIGEFNILNKFMDYSKNLEKQSNILTGTISADYSAFDTETNTYIPIKITGNIDGLTSDNNADIKSEINYDFSSIIPQEDLLSLSTIKNININCKIDNNSGKLYIQIPQIQSIFGINETTWFCLDIQQLLDIANPDFNLNYKDFLNLDNYKDIVKNNIDYTLNNNTLLNDIYTYEALKSVFSMYNDNSFIKEGNIYKSSFSINNEDVNYTINLNINVDENDSIISYNTSQQISSPNLINLEINSSLDEQNNINVLFNIDMENLLKYKFDANIKLIPTQDKPNYVPDTNSEIINIIDLLTSDIDE